MILVIACDVPTSRPLYISIYKNIRHINEIADTSIITDCVVGSSAYSNVYFFSKTGGIQDAIAADKNINKDF